VRRAVNRPASTSRASAAPPWDDLNCAFVERASRELRPRTAITPRAPSLTPGEPTMAPGIRVGRRRRRVRRDTHDDESHGVGRAAADGTILVDRRHDARGLAESAEDAESADAENDVPRDESISTPQSLAPSTSVVGSSVRSSVWTRIRPFVVAKCPAALRIAQPRTASSASDVSAIDTALNGASVHADVRCRPKDAAFAHSSVVDGERGGAIDVVSASGVSKTTRGADAIRSRRRWRGSRRGARPGAPFRRHATDRRQGSRRRRVAAPAPGSPTRPPPARVDRRGRLSSPLAARRTYPIRP